MLPTIFHNLMGLVNITAKVINKDSIRTCLAEFETMRWKCVTAKVWNTPEMMREVNGMQSEEVVAAQLLAIKDVGRRGMPRTRGAQGLASGSVTLP